MPKLSDFKAILFDVDSTISNTQKIITTQTIEALHALPQSITQGLCTGRIFASLEKYAFQYFSDKALHIICGGAQLVTATGTVIWQECIPVETSFKLCQELLDNKIEFLVARDHQMFATPTWKRQLEEGSVPIALFDLTEVPTWETPLISIHVADAVSKQIVAKYSDINAKELNSRTGNTYFDLTAKGVTKATGLQHWSTATGIALSEVIGVGDNTNDLEFLDAVGFSVVMGNATEEIKQHADRVIGHTDQNGLAVYLQQIRQGADL